MPSEAGLKRQAAHVDFYDPVSTDRLNTLNNARLLVMCMPRACDAHPITDTEIFNLCHNLSSLCPLTVESKWAWVDGKGA